MLPHTPAMAKDSESGHLRRHHDMGGLEAGPVDRDGHGAVLAKLVNRDSMIGVTLPDAPAN